MKKMLSIITTAVLVLSLFTGTAFANPGNGNGNGKGNGQGKWKVQKEFKDMRGHWGGQSVQKMQSLGILDGYADGTFQPDKALTQAELAVMIDRMLDLRQGAADDAEDITDDEGLSDIPDWAKKAVSKGFQKQYLNHKRFHSQVQCDRLTACVAIAKALELDPVTDFSNNPFNDRGLINDEDYGYLLALYEAGYISGYPNGNFNPNSFLSRVQIANIIENLLEDLKDEDQNSDDETAPTWDNDSVVTAAAIHANSVDLKWEAAEDDIKVVGYKVIYEIDDADKVKYVSGRTITISGLESNEEYTFTVEAKDAAGNWSDDGPNVDVTTLEEDEEDTENPTWPDDAVLTVSSSESGIVTLVWPDAEDNVGVEDYKIYQDGQLIKTVAEDDNNINVTNLEEDTEYTFKVRAVDEAGNLSSSLSRTYLTE